MIPRERERPQEPEAFGSAFWPSARSRVPGDPLPGQVQRPPRAALPFETLQDGRPPVEVVARYGGEGPRPSQGLERRQVLGARGHGAEGRGQLRGQGRGVARALPGQTEARQVEGGGAGDPEVVAERIVRDRLLTGRDRLSAA